MLEHENGRATQVQVLEQNALACCATHCMIGEHFITDLVAAWLQIGRHLRGDVEHMLDQSRRTRFPPTAKSSGRHLERGGGT